MRATLSVALITLNEERSLGATLASVAWADEIVVVDSGSSDGTQRIAEAAGARWVAAPWRGFAAQKNHALELCTSDWLLSLDADEVVSPELAASILEVLDGADANGEDDDAGGAPDAASYPGRTAYAGGTAYSVARRNLFLGRSIRHGGYYPDRKLRLFRRGQARFRETPVHETLDFEGRVLPLGGDLVHDAYPTLEEYLEHMQRYSSLGAELACSRGWTGRGPAAFLVGVALNPWATFLYNYLLRGGFLDGREGLLLHLYHSAYVSWKYAKAWERARAEQARGARAR